ncbi:MAG TPA: hypothetical protein VLX92_14805 [Kofleriaceae bacterium]|nr:hypothetical protein [Kofleriaceae bacterium]
MRALAIVALLAAPAAAGELRSAGPLAIRAPDGLVLGRDATAELRWRAAAGLRLVASAGAIAAPAREGGELRATWTLPAEHRPQIAIVAAIGDDGAVRDWIAVPLAGQARIKVETAPRASVTVALDRQTFGPVTADSRGIALVPVVVPPGVTDAEATSTSTWGTTTHEPVALGAPPAPRGLAVCAPAGDRVRVIATTALGAPATAVPQLAVSAGRAAPLVAVAPGVFEAAVASDDVAAASITATAELGDGAPAVRCELAVPPEPPSAIALVADRAAFASGGAPIELRATLAYAGHRRPLAVAAIALEPELGAIEPAGRDGATFIARWQLPAAFGGRTRARVRARVAGVTTALTVELVPGPAARIVAPPPAPVRADGRTAGQLVARVVDRAGNPIAHAELAARGRGRLGAFAARGDALVASYVAPESHDGGSDTVELAAAGVSARVAVPLEPEPYRFALDARLGYLTNFGRIAAPVGVLAGSVRILDHVLVGGELAGYRAAFDAPAGGETVAAQITALPVLARVAYQRALGGIELTGGAGLGVAFAETRVSSPSAGDATGATEALAGSAFASASTRLGPGRALVEAEYVQATIGGAVSGRIGGLVLGAGYGFDL